MKQLCSFEIVELPLASFLDQLVTKENVKFAMSDCMEKKFNSIRTIYVRIICNTYYRLVVIYDYLVINVHKLNMRVRVFCRHFHVHIDLKLISAVY